MPSEIAKPENVPQNLQLINAPEWFVNGAQILWAGNDPIILFNKIMPSLPAPAEGPGVQQGLAYVAPIGMVRLSSEALKELSEAIRSAIELREKDIGKVIETEAMRVAAAQREK